MLLLFITKTRNKKTRPGFIKQYLKIVKWILSKKKKKKKSAVRFFLNSRWHFIT